jgi:hypothetical protein
MTITFENDNDVIIYALEKVISYARRTQQIFVAHCVWWLASVIGLEQGLIIFIDNIQSQVEVAVHSEANEAPSERQEACVPEQSIGQVHTDRIPNITQARSVSAVPRDLTEDQRLDRILDSAERVIQESFRDRSHLQYSRVNPLPSTKAQLKKARKTKRLQEARDKAERERQERLRQLGDQVIEKLTRDGLV